MIFHINCPVNLEVIQLRTIGQSNQGISKKKGKLNSLISFLSHSNATFSVLKSLLNSYFWRKGRNLL